MIRGLALSFMLAALIGCAETPPGSPAPEPEPILVGPRSTAGVWVQAGPIGGQAVRAKLHLAPDTAYHYALDLPDEATLVLVVLRLVPKNAPGNGVKLILARLDNTTGEANEITSAVDVDPSDLPRDIVLIAHELIDLYAFNYRLDLSAEPGSAQGYDLLSPPLIAYLKPTPSSP